MNGAKRVTLDRIASAARHARPGREAWIGPEIPAAEGVVVVARILTDKNSYNTLEDPSGRMVPLRAGDVIAGVLGRRSALQGYAGEVPAAVAAGDILQVLNLGGVIGRCTSMNPEIGAPFDCEILGALLEFPALGDRIGRPATIGAGPVKPRDALRPGAPVVFVAGSCMNAGKTVAASELVRGFSRTGLKVAAAKLTGVALLRDSLAMRDAGAGAVLTFNDAGAACTSADNSAAIAKGILSALREGEPDLILAELGDGLLGEYGVQAILADPQLAGAAGALVVAAPDPVACWGAKQLLAGEYGLPVTVFTGPATDNAVGRDYLTGQLGVPAHNARRDGAGLLACVRAALAECAAARRVAS